MWWWHRRPRMFGFEFGFRPPFGLFFRGMRPPRREEYLKMLERYKEDLEAELEEVTKEIAELKKRGPE